MQFAMVSFDRYLGILNSFLKEGWRPLKFFSSPSQNEFDDNRIFVAEAARLGIEVQLDRITASDLFELKDQGCDALVVAGYKWKIPDPKEILKYAINFHPSPLPIGRGPYPLPRAILENFTYWGVSCHRINNSFDAGDILCAKNFALSSDECHESLTLKVELNSNWLAAHVAQNVDFLWRNAQRQNEGSYWAGPSIEERIINFDHSAENILRRIRSFGSLGTFAIFGESWFIVKRAIGWQEHHLCVPGQIINFNQGKLTVAARDGYIGILELAAFNSKPEQIHT